MTVFLLSTMENLHEELRDNLREEIAKRGNKVAYVSSIPQTDDKKYYLSTIADYQAISPYIDVDYYDLSESFSDEDLIGIAAHSAIYLSGGNTFSFMSMARKRNLKNILATHLDNDGLLIGASAGALMMTPSIEVAKLADSNDVGLEDMTGFGFVDFEFYPHYTGVDARERDVLEEYTKERPTIMYACHDGEGICIASNDIRQFGDVEQLSL